MTSLDYPTRLFIEHSLFVFAALFPVVNPLGGAPVFLAMTQGMPDMQRALLARRIGVNAFLLVMGSILAGNYVIGFFGLSVPVVQVGGGLLVCALAWQLLHNETADQLRIGPTTPEQLAARAFYPMTLPLTVGPGSISVAITLGAQSPRDASGYAISIAASTVGALSLAASIYFLFRYADRMARFLGTAGTQVLLRLSAFILLCIGVQIVWNGAFALLGTIPTFRAR